MYVAEAYILCTDIGLSAGDGADMVSCLETLCFSEFTPVVEHNGLVAVSLFLLKILLSASSLISAVVASILRLLRKGDFSV